MKFTKLKSGVNAEWKATTDKATFFINKSTTPNLGIVSYQVIVCFENDSMKYLADNLQYLKDAKAVAENKLKQLKN